MNPCRQPKGRTTAATSTRPGKGRSDARLARDVHAALLEEPADLIQGRAGPPFEVEDGDAEAGRGAVRGQVPVEGADDHLTVLASEAGQGGRHRPGVRLVIGRRV